MTHWLDRDRLLRVWRYVQVGVASAIVDFAVTWICFQFLPIVAANTIGFLTANLLNFWVAHGWVFRRSHSESGLFITYTAVLLISAIGLVISNMLVWFLIAQLGLGFFVGKIVAAIVVLIWNYSARSKFVYK